MTHTPPNHKSTRRRNDGRHATKEQNKEDKTKQKTRREGLWKKMWSFWLVCSLIVLLIVELGKFLNRVREILPFVTKDKILDDCFLSRRWKTKRSLHCCHRGGAFAFGPENTFANFDRCLEIGTDMIEVRRPCRSLFSFFLFSFVSLVLMML